ncbi:hypothetical protein B0H14DRAFT_2582555 [Mycena olivaceomarginata]|nr:hypothetical protein B0H14DRAFT_2582555 [Mycena olivaceomarginata]
MPQKSPEVETKFTPAHAFCLPAIGHHSVLWDQIQEFHQTLLPSGNTNPAIEGLDQSILIDPRRLHLTIGVMALSSMESSTQQSNTSGPGKTVSEAIDLLHSLGPKINAITH